MCVSARVEARTFVNLAMCLVQKSDPDGSESHPNRCSPR
uniref:Uncharacterized protein n=1 Tax=Anopheles dirus TaxID=7168 RepID=A0A182NYR7_9DIPT